VNEVAPHLGVAEPAIRVEAENLVPRFHEQPPRPARDRQRRLGIDRRLFDEAALVFDTALREELSRARAGRSAVAVVKDCPNHHGGS
jgi:hypothetical protein